MENKSKYSVVQQAFGKFTEYRLTNNQNGSYIAVVPEFGANLNQAAIYVNNELHEILLGPENQEKLVSENNIYYKGSQLLPFPNRLNHGNYSFENKSYHLDTNETSRDCSLHGLVSDKHFTVESTSADDDSAKLVTSYEYDGSNEGYPFKYFARLTFELKGNGFTCTTFLKNIDNKNIPIGSGVHPYFKTGSLVDDWIVTLPECESLEFDDRYIPTTKKDFFGEFEKGVQFGSRDLNACYVFDPKQDRAIKMEIQDKNKDLRMVIWQEAGPNKYNYLQVYTPSDRKSMAIEPMTCAPDAFNNKFGLITLAAQDTTEFSWGVNLSSDSL